MSRRKSPPSKHRTREAENAKRSFHMDRSASEEIGVLAKAHDRSWSGEMQWLVRLGLRARHLLPAACPKLEDDRRRKYFYPSVEVSQELDALLDEKNVNRPYPGHAWSFSALVRLLSAQGMRVERQIARGVSSAMTRLDSAGEASRAPSVRALATTLMLRHSTDTLGDMLGTAPPGDVLLKWGVGVSLGWESAVATALECRARLDELEEP